MEIWSILGLVTALVSKRLNIEKNSFCTLKKTFVCPSSKCSFLVLHLWASVYKLDVISWTKYLALTIQMSNRRTIFQMNLPEIVGQQSEFLNNQHKMNNWFNICCKLLQKKNAFSVQQPLLCTHTRGVRKEFSSCVTCPNVDYSETPFLILKSIFSPGSMCITERT